MKYEVCINIKSDYNCIVEAKSKVDAFNKAMEACGYDLGIWFHPLEDVYIENCDIEEITEGK